MGRQRTPQQLAKIISYILGRRPDEFGMVLDNNGYVKIKDLLRVLGEEDGWRYVRRGHIDEILYTLTDPPIEIEDLHIRAAQREKLPVVAPAENLPKLLYHGIRRRAHPNVIQKGIFPGANSYVILSSDKTMAERMGRRIDPSPVLLTIQVHDSIAKRVEFLQAGESLYLAEFIPPDCFTGPPLPKEKPETEKHAGKKESEITPPSPGSFVLDLDIDKKAKNRSKREKKKEISRERSRDRKRKQREKMW
jgi:putative RNA 2'-phosphotransferase